MTVYARGFVGGLACALACAAVVGWWLSREPEARVVVAATDIAEGTTVTIALLDDAWVPERFVSARKLGAVQVGAVMGRAAPQALRARDFVDPTHFGPTEDACVLDARAAGRRLGVDGARLDAFVEALRVAPAE